ncbi:MAG: tetratricopeptide repeat protein [Candidatus Eisenbacteria bacterium]|nr:tetratricopeptide repeat protein [Candidatus Eisenbacteria bacterium]
MNRTIVTCVALCCLLAAVSAAGAQEMVPDKAAALADRIAELEEAIEASPEDIELRIELGNLYYESNMLDQAQTVYVEASRIDSSHTGVLVNLASLYSDMGRAKEALPLLERALRHEPRDPIIYTNLGSVYYDQQRYQEAVDMYQMAISIDPECIEAHFNLGVAFADARIFEEAIREWQRVIEIEPTSQAAKISRDNIQMIRQFRGE